MTEQTKRITQQASFITSGKRQKILSGDHSILEPPEPMPNSEVKQDSVDGSVGSPHVRVEHRQAPNLEKALN